MKRYISAVLAATLIVGLTACGGGTPVARTAPTSSVSATPAPTSRPVPDVAGKTFPEARKILNKAGFYGSAWDKDGKKWGSIPPDDAVKVTSTTPAAGTVTDTDEIHIQVAVTEAENTAALKVKADAAKAAADAAKLAKRYEFTCGPNPYSTAGIDVYHSLKDVWSSKHYAGSDKCITKIDGQYADAKPAVIPSEQAIVAVVAANGGDASGSPAQAFDTVLRLCAKPDPDFADAVFAKPEWKTARAKAALALCPDAPHAALLQEVTTAVKINDGTHTVGVNMEPGTYQTKPNMKDCYWSRTTGGGGIIANDFVGFAPAGVTVTVYPGEGFESTRCGVWTKTG
ncbi:MAG TPA: PASTA domain-containing protein [Arthrobacter sp.]